MKHAIYTGGPIVGKFLVYLDLQVYSQSVGEYDKGGVSYKYDYLQNPWKESKGIYIHTTSDKCPYTAIGKIHKPKTNELAYPETIADGGHAVAIVGWGRDYVELKNRQGEYTHCGLLDFWWLRNSWGPNWGVSYKYKDVQKPAKSTSGCPTGSSLSHICKKSPPNSKTSKRGYFKMAMYGGGPVNNHSISWINTDIGIDIPVHQCSTSQGNTQCICFGGAVNLKVKSDKCKSVIECAELVVEKYTNSKKSKKQYFGGWIMVLVFICLVVLIFISFLTLKILSHTKLNKKRRRIKR